MSTLLNFGRDVQGFSAFAPVPSTDLYSATLLAAGESHITTPKTHANWIVSFSYQPGSVIWVRVGGVAAAPVGNTFASNSSYLLPGSFSVGSNVEISMYNNGLNAADIMIALYVPGLGAY